MLPHVFPFKRISIHVLKSMKPLQLKLDAHRYAQDVQSDAKRRLACLVDPRTHAWDWAKQ